MIRYRGGVSRVLGKVALAGLWFRALWWVTGQKQGASALGLQRLLGLGSFRTAWTWQHKLRRAMVRPGRERLHGWVEVDETCVGGAEQGIRGRKTVTKAVVAIAVEVQQDGPGLGRTRMRVVADASARSLLAFVRWAVAPGSTVHTDGWPSCGRLGELGYRHEADTHRDPQQAGDLLPHAHRVTTLFKRWRLGTHQGAIRVHHLDRYLDEFSFRFNRRKSRSRGMLFYRLAQHAAAIEPVPYKAIVGGSPKGQRPQQPIGDTPQDIVGAGVKCISQFGSSSDSRRFARSPGAGPRRAVRSRRRRGRAATGRTRA